MFNCFYQYQIIIKTTVETGRGKRLLQPPNPAANGNAY